MRIHAERVADSFDNGSDEYHVALFHDAVEDGWMMPDEIPDYIRAPVLILTRNDGETYKDYIERVRTSGSSTAIAVKIADARDNLARCEGKFEGYPNPSLAERYRYVIEQLSG